MFILYRADNKIGFKIVQIIWEWCFHCLYLGISVIGPLEKLKAVGVGFGQGGTSTSIGIL